MIRLLGLLSGLALQFYLIPSFGSSANSTRQFRHNGIVNDDHGIITEDDLKLADENSHPPPPFDGTNKSYPYWQCFAKGTLKFKCEYESPLNREGSTFTLNIETTSESHFYSLSHTISGDACDVLKRNVVRVLRNQQMFCINGTNDSLSISGNKKKYFWTFFRMKSKTGYAHYFVP